MSEHHLDLQGLKCPLPALKTRKALRAIAAGDLLVVACTDPMAAIDIPHLVHETGDVLEHRSIASDDALMFPDSQGGARLTTLSPAGWRA